MTQEDKKLLLQDLCSRLPYGVKVSIECSKGKYTHIYDLREIDNDATSDLRQQVTVWNYGFYSSVISYPLIDCRAYLRPMSNMTKQEYVEYSILWNLQDEFPTDADIRLKVDVFDWLNKKHFDYRGLIPKGLAIEVTEENNPYEN